MGQKSKHEGALGRQFAALPFKEHAGETLVLLVTSRDTGRWVLPKGWAERGLSGAELAAREAYEEAGIRGVTVDKSVGSYHYSKRLPEGRRVDCLVEVFPLRVTEVLETWPEAHQRRREWFPLGRAALHVDESELVTMLEALADPNAGPEMGLLQVPRSEHRAN